MQRLSERYDGKWGREIREHVRREHGSLTAQDLIRLRGIAERAELAVPGPWAVSEANFIVHDYSNNDPETGKAVAEVDCYNEHTEVKTAYIAAFDPVTCLRLLELAMKGL